MEKLLNGENKPSNGWFQASDEDGWWKTQMIWLIKYFSSIWKITSIS